MLALILLLSGSGGAGLARADDVSTEVPTADDVLDTLKRTLAWLQQTRVVAQAAKEAAVVLAVNEEEPAALRVVQRAFEVARAQAALLAQLDGAESNSMTPTARRAQRRARLEVAIREQERGLARLRERPGTAPRLRRAALAKEITAAEHRLAIDRLRLELLGSLEQADASLGSDDGDLAQQIQGLEEAVSGLSASGASPRPAAAQAPAPPPAPVPTTGTWGIVRRWLVLRRVRGQLSQVERTTEELAREVDVQVETTRTIVRELARRLREQIDGPPGDGVAEQHFKRQLQRMKLLGGVLVPLRTEAALLRRFQSDLQGWQRAIDYASRKGLQDLAIGLAGVVIALVVIGLGALAVAHRHRAVHQGSVPPAAPAADAQHRGRAPPSCSSSSSTSRTSSPRSWRPSASQPRVSPSRSRT